MSHSGDDETSRRGRYWARTGSSGEDGAVPNSPVRRGDGRGDGDGGDDDGGDGGESYARRTTKRLTGGAGLPAGVSERERERLAGGVGSSARERGSAERAACAREAGRNWAENGGSWSRGGGPPRHGLDSTQIRGEREFLFSFLFSNSYIHFLFFSFDN
jgi:hypothetical protein